MNMKERVCFPSPHTSNSEVDTTALRQKAAGTLYDDYDDDDDVCDDDDDDAVAGDESMR